MTNYLKRIIGKFKDKSQKKNRINVKAASFIHKDAKLENAIISGNVNIGTGVKIRGGVIISAQSKLTVNRYTSLNGPGTDIVSMLNPVTIGSFTSIARGVTIQEFNH